jgi:hypothetical protein
MPATCAPETDVSPSPPNVARNLAPLAIDVAAPLAVYYGLRYGAQLSLVDALIASSAVPLLRSVASLLRERAVNGLALLMLSVNLAGIVLSFVSGDARVIFAKDSGISSVIAIGLLVSVVRGRPVMTAGLRPWITKGEAGRESAWDRLAGSAPFVRYERRFTAIWGVVLLGDCAARLVCAFTVPIGVLGWLASAILVGALAVATIVAGGAAAQPLEQLVVAEAAPGGITGTGPVVAPER